MPGKEHYARIHQSPRPCPSPDMQITILHPPRLRVLLLHDLRRTLRRQLPVVVVVAARRNAHPVELPRGIVDLGTGRRRPRCVLGAFFLDSHRVFKEGLDRPHSLRVHEVSKCIGREHGAHHEIARVSEQGRLLSHRIPEGEIEGLGGQVQAPQALWGENHELAGARVDDSHGLLPGTVEVEATDARSSAARLDEGNGIRVGNLLGGFPSHPPLGNALSVFWDFVVLGRVAVA